MSEPGLESLRHEGAEHLDPARFHYLEVLSRRVHAASGEVRRILEGKLGKALTDYSERFTQAQQEARDEVTHLSIQHPELAPELRTLFAASNYRGVRRLGAQTAANAPCAPLAQLNQHIRAITQDGNDRGLGNDGEARSEIKSVRRFRETWSKIAAENQVDQAFGRGPENAGPLNSHMLVLHSLALMRNLSPDYLRRFLSQTDTLLWLDQVNQKYTLMDAKPARRSRQKK